VRLYLRRLARRRPASERPAPERPAPERPAWSWEARPPRSVWTSLTLILRGTAAVSGATAGAGGIGAPVINCGGGMVVDYRAPGHAVRLGGVRAGARTRVDAADRAGEVGVTAYCGWYVTRVLDVKRSYGETFAVVAGGTRHLRTLAAKGHEPCVLLRDRGVAGAARDRGHCGVRLGWCVRLEHFALFMPYVPRAVISLCLRSIDFGAVRTWRGLSRRID
jgi:hypothetical protein